MSLDERRATAHRDHLAALCAEGGPLTAASANASVNNPAWFVTVGGVPRPRAAREELHSRLLAEARTRAEHVRQDRRAIVLAGPPGAGKSSTVNGAIAATGDQLEHWRVIDADDFKDLLLLEALRDGSYATWLTPPAIAALEGAGERFFPRELASLVHAESALLARRATRDSLRAGDNVIIDGTLSDARTANLLIDELARADYQVQILDVEAREDVVEARIEARWRSGYEEAHAAGADADKGNRHLGGRWVPSSFVRSLFPEGLHAQSACAAVARAVAYSHPAVQLYERHEVPAADAAPELVERLGREGSGPLVDQETLDAVRAGQAAKRAPSASSTRHQPAPPRRDDRHERF